MTRFQRIKCSRVQPSDNDNRITITLLDGTSYAVNQRSLNRFATGDELKAALEKFLGYAVPDIWFHKNRSGTWAIATGEFPNIWPEDEVTA